MNYLAQRKRFPPIVSAVLAGTVGSILALLSATEVLSQRTLFVALTILLMSYLSVEVLRVRRVHSQRWLLNPVVLASFLTFALSFGTGNLLFFLPGEVVQAFGLVPDVTPSMVKLMWLALLGAMAMWLGYWSPFAARLSGSAMQRKASRWLSPASNSRAMAVPLIAGIATIARLWLIKLGLYGYNSSSERLIEMGSVTQYFSIAASLGPIALVIAAMDYYSDRARFRHTFLLVAVFLLEIAFGFMSGFKSQVAMPFVIVGMCHYLRKGGVPKVWLVGFVVALTIAYAVIEPFRAARNERADYQGTSVAEIIDTLIAGQQPGSGAADSDQEPRVWLTILARSSLTYVGSIGIEYRDKHEDLPQGSPRFVRNIFLSPIYAWVPRAIWKSKPLGDLGAWYTQVVMGFNKSRSATSMSAVTYLYFAGGGMAIFLGFFALGIVQRMLFFLTRPDIRPAGAIVFFAMLPTMSVVESAVDGALVFVFRMLPMLLIFQYFVYRRIRVGHD